MLGGVGRGHTLVNEAYEIGETMVAEDHVHLRLAFLVAVDAIELARAVEVRSPRRSRSMNDSRVRPRTPSSVAIHWTP